MVTDSTFFQLTHLYHLFCKALDDKKDGLYFGTYLGTYQKLLTGSGIRVSCTSFIKIGIRGNLLNWFENYLENQQQRVIINGEYSSWSKILAGVPRVSLIGPLLLLFDINDISMVLISDGTHGLFFQPKLHGLTRVEPELDLIHKI